MRAGNRLIGLRCNDSDLADRLRAAVGAHLEPNIEAPPNLSLKLGRARGNVTDFHWLYRGGRQVLRTRSIKRLLRVALLHVDALAGGDPGLNARLLEIHGTPVLLDNDLVPAFDTVERRAERLGCRVIDTAGVLIDSTRSRIVLPAPTIDSAWADVRTPDPEDDGQVLVPGWLPLKDVVVLEVQTADAATATSQIVALARMTARPGRPLRERDLDLAVQLHDRCSIHSCANEGAALLATLTRLATAAASGRAGDETPAG